ncbi:2-dehydro-3-deoxy-6-phosphogalactonate aldolase [Alloiococcus otitis]|uniref:2-dehydro-3-deoxyphosphogluconate aldolase/4-hydroxy-2-oxoglutarate aldolase n=1 Tax=Alloiococcus otitis ATCC 51267 TaxID=883081 RepID=K9E9N0_9LACT|nr:bifunctional 2-keto-4-hydroxyglutarate aldolase/2-keto-3-deoxy-6-phosphogluconate aldolase [Alloiococcus otitis]EKU93899.1 2-dehydro-3-deoxyphosphogluconate aldolase/4-hydroxy-2-oxoglutarate aldolase [Alloiococcus otitis ATCC 51267]SUU81708.1 2-dehydro-3-deoxy-6-phosphogalactonate aldolase [Alloiococcus otitis]
MKKMKVLKRLHDHYIFAVVRGKDQDHAVSISQAAFQAGIKNIEVTFTTPEADRAIASLVQANQDTDMLVGAGTVLDAQTASLAIQKGAQFVVSPHFDPAIAEVCNLYTTPYLPGCASVNEIVTALRAGVDVVKLFPGGLLGPKFIQDVHGPLPNVEMMPSGGVDLDNIEDWYKAGAWAVGVGSALTKNAQGQDDITINASRFVAKLKEVRGY